MSGKQLKIALSDDLYKKLSQEAQKHSMPVSTYARALMTGQLDEESSQVEKPVATPSQTPKVEMKEDLILLSDVLADSQEDDEKSKTSHANTSLKTSDGKPINIQITIN